MRPTWLLLTSGLGTAMAVDCGAIRGQIAGSQYADSCEQCPSSYGPYFCQADCKWCDDGSPAEYVAFDARCKPVGQPCAPLPPSPPAPPPRDLGDVVNGGCVLVAGTEEACEGSVVFEANVFKWHLSEEWCTVACIRDPRCTVAQYTPSTLMFGMMAPYCKHYATMESCDLQPVPPGSDDAANLVFECPDPPRVDCAALVADGLPCGAAAGGAVCANCCSIEGVCGSDQGSCNRQHGAHPGYSASGFVQSMRTRPSSQGRGPAPCVWLAQTLGAPDGPRSRRCGC